MVYKVKFWIHAVQAVHIPINLPGCTEDLCQTKCSEYAIKHKHVVKRSHCDKPDLCHCVLSPKPYVPLTTEVMGLADAEDDNETFV